MREDRAIPTGPALFLLIAAALAAMAGGMILADGGGVEGVRLAIRATARTSLALFLLAFAASALVRLWPGSGTRWLLANRRWFGLGFAFSHLVHAGAIFLLHRWHPDTFALLVQPRTFVTGGIAYLFIALLAATSFDRAVAALGPKSWKRLHSIGLWVIWVSFVFTNGKRIPASTVYTIPVAILFAALALRLWAARRGRRIAVPA
jgi:methionine sulfoxide reductase heme-binding subunit